MKRWNVRIGINPLSWMNDDLPALGADTPLETALREGASIGYAGFELGNRFPQEPEALKATLARYGLACVSGWYPGHLAQGSVALEMARCAAHLEKLRFNGCRVVIYGEVADSIQGRMDLPLAKRPRFSNSKQWTGYAQRLNIFGAHLKLNYGLTLAYHHHMGAYVQSPEDIDTLMGLTEPGCVSLLFDTGHAYFGGASDPVQLLKKHAHRVAHVHCKDVRPDVIRQARSEGWSFLDGVLQGIFTVPGDGVLDYDTLLATLRKAGYRGWLVVEAEQDPAVAPSYAYALKGYKTLRRIVDRLSAV